MPSVYGDTRDERMRQAASAARRVSLTSPSRSVVAPLARSPALAEGDAGPTPRAQAPATPRVAAPAARTPLAADPRSVSPADTRPTTLARTPMSAAPAETPASVFTETNNLRGTVVNPVATGSLDQARAALDRLAAMRPTLAGMMNQQVAAPTSYAPSAEAAAARARMMEGVDSLYTTPDRMGLASEALSIYDQQSQPVLDQALRSVMGRAAAGGRMRAGMTTNELTDVGTQWKRDRDIFGRTIINDALQQAMSDRLNRLGATQSAAGFFSGDDAQTAGINQGLREEARAELARRFGMGEAVAGLDASLFGLESNLANNQYDWGERQRQEVRGERGYQDDMAREALANRERQVRLEDDLQTSDTNRQLAWIKSLIQAGMDPGLIQALLAQGD